ncbi:MAG: hypothetical protein VB071_06000 [Lawsonibacter sp.]|nr:hypothetical protein [Lawsonibacter sp.]
MRWVKESGKATLISIGFTLLFILPFPGFRESWGYVFGFGLTVFELPVLIESEELTLLKKVGLTFTLGALSVLLIRFFCEAERIGRYLSFYVTIYGLGILTLLLKRCYIKWKASRSKSE